MTMPKLWGGGGVRASQLNTAHGKKLISASLVERVQEESFESATFKGYQQYMNYSYSVRVLRSPPTPTLTGKAVICFSNVAFVAIQNG